MTTPLKGKLTYWALQRPDGKLAKRREHWVPKTDMDPPWSSLVLFSTKAIASEVANEYIRFANCTPVKIKISFKD
jgi:hypothetical protein